MQRTLVLILILLCGISFGKIRILTNVSGVEIRAGHSLLGFIDQTKTAVVEITPPATLTLSKPGYLSSALPVRDASSTYYVEMIPASYITVNSTPSNAYVIFDNSFVGVTPLKLTTFPGTATLIIGKEDYTEINKTVFLHPFEEVSVSVSLPETPTVSFESNQTADLWIDDVYRGKTPLTVQLQIGEHVLRAKAEDCFDVQKSFVVTNAAAQNINIDMMPASYLKLQIPVDGVVIDLNGEKHMSGELIGPLNPGKLNVVIEAEGYAKKTLELSLNQGLNEITVELQEESHILNVLEPVDAVVKIDNIPRGRTPVKVSLIEGIHLVEIQRGSKFWLGIVDVTQDTVLRTDFSRATVVLLGNKKNTLFVVNGTSFVPPSVIYIKPGFCSLEIRSDIVSKRIVELLPGTVNYFFGDEDSGYVCLFSRVPESCFVDEMSVGISPILFLPLKSGEHVLQIGQKRTVIELLPQEILYLEQK